MNKRRRFWWGSLIALLLLLAACGQRIDTERPPEIAYGLDSCDRCKMIIDDEHFAAALWTAEKEAVRFDDAGEMFAYLQENEVEVASAWVHDYPSGDWLAAEAAYYVIGAGLSTPMGFDVAAFSDEAQAEALAYGADSIGVLSYSKLLEQLQAGELQLGSMMP